MPFAIMTPANPSSSACLIQGRAATAPPATLPGHCGAIYRGCDCVATTDRHKAVVTYQCRHLHTAIISHNQPPAAISCPGPAHPPGGAAISSNLAFQSLSGRLCWVLHPLVGLWLGSQL
ncbi:hypothetical protein Aduo_010282 [Ancylostoma duodenale]